MIADTVAHEESRLSIRLECEPERAEGPLRLAERVLVAVDALTADWLEPLAWEMLAGCHDTELGHSPWDRQPHQPYWLLCTSQLPPGVEISPSYRNHTVVKEPVLSVEQLRSWLARALAQECADAPRFVPSWRELWSLAMRVRLPTRPDDSRRSLGVSCYAGTLSIPLEYIDDEVWVSGRPEGYVIGPPVAITAGNTEGLLLDLDLAIYWDLWIEDPAGREQVEAAVRRVLALGQGWRRSED